MIEARPPDKNNNQNQDNFNILLKLPHISSTATIPDMKGDERFWVYDHALIFWPEKDTPIMDQLGITFCSTSLFFTFLTLLPSPCTSKGENGPTRTDFCRPPSFTEQKPQNHSRQFFRRFHTWAPTCCCSGDPNMMRCLALNKQPVSNQL